MRKNIKKFYEKCYLKYSFYKRTAAFKKRYKKVPKNLLRKTLDKKTIDAYIAKWRVLGQKVEIDTLLLSYNLSSKIDLNIVPENIFSVIIEKKLNPFQEGSFYEVKNVYNKWFENQVFPKCYVHKIHGIYYDQNYKVIDDVKAFAADIVDLLPFVVKASRDTYGGKDIIFVRTYEELLSSLDEFEFLVCQEVLIQNNVLNQINNAGINTIRTCLYRNEKGEFDVLNNSIRFGVNGSLDNLTSGGIVCNIHDNGFLNEYAVDRYANKVFQHPDSRIVFKDVEIPFYDKLNVIAKRIANEVVLGRLVSLDMCLDENDNWRCIEVNMFGQTIRFAQYAGKGFFGKYTEEVINEVNNLD